MFCRAGRSSVLLGLLGSSVLFAAPAPRALAAPPAHSNVLVTPSATPAPNRADRPASRMARADAPPTATSDTSPVPDTSQPGTYEVLTEEFLAPEYGATTDFDLYRPAAPGTYPAIVLGHGFSHYKDYQHDNALHLASWGFVVLAPTFSTYSDHEANGEEMLELVDWLVSSQNPYQDQVDSSRLGLAGHSAGGLSATVAAGLDAGSSHRISALVGLDPVDAGTSNRSTGIPYAEEIDAPTLYLAGIPYSCNSNGNSQGMWDAIPTATDKLYLRITRAVHCDFNDQDLDETCTAGAESAGPIAVAILLVTQGFDAAYDAFTAGTCQVDDQELDRTDEIGLERQYLAAWFLARLADETWAEAYLPGGSELEADLAAGVVEDLQH